MSQTYDAFLATKRIVAPSVGIDIDPNALHSALFPFQHDLVAWALRKGRSALFADTGLGKTLMELVWSQHVAARALHFAPLAVALQTVEEGKRWSIPVVYVRDQQEADSAGNAGAICITNYERLHLFDASRWPAIVLDESSILKNFSGVTKQALVSAFRATPYRLGGTATPAPNDTVELANHADFLGVMSPADMLSSFFISKGDDQKSNRFRLKRHAQTAFYRWMASWSMALRSPSDLGYDNAGYALPPLEILPEFIPSDWTPPGQLFALGLKGITERADVRRATLAARVERAASLVDAEPDESWLLWCGLNDESEALTRAVPDAVEVKGADAPEHKAEVLTAFARGEVKRLVTKASIAGYGLNFQRCARQAFVGLGDSYEDYYQCIRRSYRFGQQRPVRVSIVLSEPEIDVFNNVLRKEREDAERKAALIAHMHEFERDELASTQRKIDLYAPRQEIRLPAWLGRGAA